MSYLKEVDSPSLSSLSGVCVFQELQLPMLKVSAPELVSGVSGESEQKLRELFDLAVVSGAFWFLIRRSCPLSCPVLCPNIPDVC